MMIFTKKEELCVLPMRPKRFTAALEASLNVCPEVGAVRIITVI